MSVIVRFFFAFLFLCSIFGFSAFAEAKITKTERVTLDQNQHSFLIGPHSFILQDPDGTLSFRDVLQKFQHKDSWQKNDTSIINLGLNNTPVWIIFSLKNMTQNTDWAIDLGSPVSGRTSFVKALQIYDIRTPDQPFYDFGDADSPAPLSLTHLTIGQGQQTIIGLYIAPSGFLPSTIVPQVKHAKSAAFMHADHWATWLMIGFFLIAVGIFLGLAGTENLVSHGLFVLYYGLLTGLFLTITHLPLLDSSFLSNLACALLPLSCVAALFMTRAFFKISLRHYIHNMLLVSSGIFILVTAVIVLLLPEQLSLLKSILIYVPCVLTMLIMMSISFLHIKRRGQSGYFYGLAWAVVLGGFLITGLTGSGLVPTHIVTMNAYWLSLCLQTGLFIIALRHNIAFEFKTQKTTQAKEIQEIQSLERLKTSKESVDQARLIRVIERERELMAELREREMKRADDMRQARNAADEANRAKSAFLAVISHEIRTPMNGILGTLRLIKDTKLSKEQNDLLQTINRSCDGMMRLLNDILDFEKIEKGGMDLEQITFDLRKIIADVLTLMQGHAAQKKLALVHHLPDDVPHYVSGDPTRLRQVLLNLMNNALKFTDQGSVTLSLEIAAHHEEQDASGQHIYEILFAIQDTGIGITTEAQKTLFDPFRQEDVSITRRYGGSGLGLAICKSIVEAMGGDLKVDSQKDQGSRFYFSIPLRSAPEKSDQDQDKPQPQAKSASPSPSSQTGLKLLIVEDNRVNQDILRRYLTKYKHHSVVVETGEDAIQFCRAQAFDGLFIDFMLPGISGLETARAIRGATDTPNANTPMIALTGSDQKEAQAMLEQGIFNSFIQKPIDFDVLDAALQNISQGKTQTAKAAPRKQKKAAPPPKTPAPPAPASPSSPAASPPQQDSAPIFHDDPEEKTQLQAYMEHHNNAGGEHGMIILDPSKYNEKILDSLWDNLPHEQAAELLESYIVKADEIIGELHTAITQKQADVIAAKGHEIRGMAANFGVKDIADISQEIEKFGQENAVEKAADAFQRLSQANMASKQTLKSWLNAKASS